MSDDLRSLQLCELEIVHEVLKICERHKLRIYMLGGTFLGAVRHEGFIPWDDDVDLGMRRPEYELFLKYAQEELPKKYELKHFSTDPAMLNYPIQIFDNSIMVHDFAATKERVHGVWVDIFPLDGMPKSNLMINIHKMRLLYLRMMLKFSEFSEVVGISIPDRPMHERALISFCQHVNVERFLDTGKRMKLLDACMRRWPFEGSRYVINFMGLHKFKEMFPREMYEETALYPFEDLMLEAPKDYDTVCSQIYGDYMKPPKEELRNRHKIELEV